MSFISTASDVSHEYVRDVAHRLVFGDDYPGILDVGFMAPTSSPVNQEIIHSRYHHPYVNFIKREAWRKAMTKAMDRTFYPSGDEMLTRLGWVLPADLWDAEYYGWCHELHTTLQNRVKAELYVHKDYIVEIYHKPNQ